MNTAITSGSTRHSPRRRALLAPLTLLAAVLLTLSWVTVIAASSGTPASAATLTAVNQCNGTDNVGGEAVACDVSVVNNLNVATGLASSVLTVTECHGAAGAPPTCTITTTPSPQLTTSITQCNGSGNGAGGTVTCAVHVTNNITGNSTTTPASINQCNESGTGGGTQPTVVCTPIGDTTNADITQCNQSGGGGGGTMRVQCAVTASTTTSALPVTINQCIGSGTGGGALVTCTASIINNVTTPPPTIPVSSAPVTSARRSTAPVTAPPRSRSRTGSPSPSRTVHVPSRTVRASTTASPSATGTTQHAGTTSNSTTTVLTAPPSSTPSLPSTGTNSRTELGLSALLLAGGAILLRLGQRRRRIAKHR
jgi:hypothetical protein